MQTRNPVLDDIAKLATAAVGAVQGVGEEARSFARAQADKLAGELDLVPREDFEALKARVEALEARLAALDGASGANPGA
jgi:BMFP domain-containing protein YqiC